MRYSCLKKTTIAFFIFIVTGGVLQAMIDSDFEKRLEHSTEKPKFLENKSIKKKPGIDINEASEQRLCELKGVGLKRAREILKYRNEHGLFEHVEELLNIPGIGKKLFRKIRRQILLEPANHWGIHP